MKVLVTGGAGYIGSVTAHRLVARGHEVVVVDDLSRGHRAAVPKAAKLIVGDHGDVDLLRDALAGVECVMHFSAHSLVPESMENPGKYFTNNVARGVNLLEAMRMTGVSKFIFSSTCATYGEPEEMPIHEGLPQRPTNPYGESKLMFERVLEWYFNLFGIRSVRLRYFNAAGAIPEAGEDHTPETHIIPITLDVARGRREQLHLFGTDYPTPDGTCVRDYIHVSDLADAHIRALEGMDAFGTEVFNLGTGQGYSVREVIDAVETVTGKSIPVKESPRRPGDPPTLVASPEKAAAALGWRAEFVSLESMVSSAWDWYLAHPNGYPKD